MSQAGRRRPGVSGSKSVAASEAAAPGGRGSVRASGSAASGSAVSVSGLAIATSRSAVSESVSATPPAILPSDLVTVGRVLSSYGVRGSLKIEPFNAPDESVLLLSRRWYLQRPAPGRPGQAASRLGVGLPIVLPARLAVESCRVHSAVLIASVVGIDTKEAADALRGCELGVSRADFPATTKEEFYWVDLIGCSVVTPAGLALGVVDSVNHYGAHPLLRLRAAQGGETLIPFVSAHVLEVDIAARRIVADWDPDF